MNRTNPKHWSKMLGANFEYVVIIPVALTVGILSLIDVISSTKTLIATTLAVLALMAFSALHQNSSKEEQTNATASLQNSVTELDLSLASLREQLNASQSVAELPGGTARNDAFKKALTNPSIWHFRGCMGSFLRAETLKHVAAAALQRAGSRSHVTIQILDPADNAVCEEYATYRRRLEQQRNPDSMESWTADRVRFECIASLLAATWFHQHGNLDIKAGLSARMSTLRYDISDEVLLITNEDRNIPALAIMRSSRMYYAMVADLEVTLKNSRRIDIGDAPTLPYEWPDISHDELAACMNTFGVTHQLGTGDREEILALAFNRKNDHYQRG